MSRRCSADFGEWALVARIRSSPHICRAFFSELRIRRTLEIYDSSVVWFGSSLEAGAAKMKRTSEPPHWQRAILRSGLRGLITGHRLVQLETLAANEGAKVLPFGDGDLARLVLRPAIERWPAEALDLAPVPLGDR